MTALKIARIAAALVGIATFAFLFRHDSWHLDNIFLIPDLLLSAALVIAAGLPDRIAGPAMPAAFCFAAGVLATSAAAYAVDGRIGIPSLLGAVGSLIMAAVLVRLDAPGKAALG